MLKTLFDKYKKLLLKKSYFFRIFLVISSVCLLASVIVCIGLFRVEFISDTSDVQNTIQSNNDRFSLWNDTRISTAQSILNTLQYNDDVMKYSITGDIQYLFNISRSLDSYGNMLANFKTNLGFIDMQNNFNVTPTEINRLDIKKIHFPDSLDTSNYTMSEDNELYFLNGYSFQGKTFYKKRIYADNRDLIFFYTLYENTDFESDANNDDNYCIIYNNTLIYSTNKDANEEIVNTFIETPTGFSKQNGYTAYKSISRSDPSFKYIYYAKSPSIFMLCIEMLGLFLILCIISLVFSMFLTKIMYSPISELIKKFRSVDNISDESDDMKYLSNNLDKMLEDLSRLEEEHAENHTMVINKFLGSLCVGAVSSDYCERFIEKYNLSILKHRFLPVSFIIMNDTEITQCYGADGLVYIKKDIIDMLENIFSDFYYYEDSYQSFVIFTNEKKQAIVSAVSKITDMLESDFDLSVKVIIGREINNYKFIESAYKEILLIKNDPFSPSDGNNICFADEYHTPKTSSLNYTIEMERQLIDYMIYGRYDEAKQMIDLVINQNFTEKVSKSIVLGLQACFHTTITRILSYLGKDPEEIYTDKDILSFSISEKTPLELKESLRHMFDPLIDAIPSQKEDASSDDRSKISNYIEANIKNNIGLDDLAEYMNYSSWYMSKLFKNIFNQNFKTYVNMRRVEIAKKLLDNGAKVSDVSAQVGCTHIETFIRIFKKHTGVLPSEYSKHTQNSI